MAKMKDALTLTAITLVAGLLLGGVYELTKETIAQQQIAANAEAYRTVYPSAAEFKGDDALSDKVKASSELLENSGLSLGNVSIDDAVYACDEGGNLTGVVVSATSKDGYDGTIRIAVGVAENGDEKTVTGIDFLEINETPGLGMRATEDSFKNQFQNKTVESFELTKGGASADNEIDALSGASFTSNAVTNAVNAALYFARESALAQ